MSLRIIDNGFGELPKDRGNNHIVWGCISLAISAVFIALYRFWYTLDFLTWDDGYLLGAVLFSITMGRAFRTFLLYAEERKHLSSRYGNCRMKAFHACLFLPPTYILVIMLVAGFLSYKHHTDSENILLSWPVQLIIALLVALYPLLVAFYARPLSKAEISRLNETQNNHVADGLAWSYYFGYLKFMLPTLNAIVSEAVAPSYSVDGEDVRDLLTCKKLLIVIPKGSYCFETFNDPRIIPITNLPELKRNHAGVKERSYKFSLHQVQVNPDDKPLYVVMEYATPVLSMYRMAEHNSDNFSKEDLEIQVKEFSKKLKSILDADPECQGRYELVLVGNADGTLADTVYHIVEDMKNRF